MLAGIVIIALLSAGIWGLLKIPEAIEVKGREHDPGKGVREVVLGIVYLAVGILIFHAVRPFGVGLDHTYRALV